MEMEGLRGILDRILQVEAAGGDQLTEAAPSSANASTDLGSRRTLLPGSGPRRDCISRPTPAGSALWRTSGVPPGLTLEREWRGIRMPGKAASCELAALVMPVTLAVLALPRGPY